MRTASKLSVLVVDDDQDIREYLQDFLLAVEGVSHFVYLVHRARQERPVSAVELELQAEVDKYLVALLVTWNQTGEPPPGFGHRLHTRDPRAARLFQMALELELEGEHVRLMRTVERTLDAHKARSGRPMPVNVDGAIAAICADLGFAYELGNAIFLISRLPGLIAHAHEERTRQHPMRQIDPKDHDYDGARERRLPERRK